ncbi:MAG: LptF/LptG family permease [bacterium]|nr:LptF/LptG family permease [bacterium]
MLSILDKYIIKRFLQTFFFIFGVVMLLSIVFDISEKLSYFLERNATWQEVVFDYYISFILYFGNMFSFLIIFISVIWFTAKMARDTEIIPILNSGKPFGRFVRPYMISATLLMLISLILNHFVIPNTNRLRLDFEEKYYREVMIIDTYHAEYPGGQIVHFKSYDSRTDRAVGFVLEQEDETGLGVSYFIKAETAENIPGTDKWVLRNYYERIHGDTNDIIRDGLRKDTTFQFRMSEIAKRENVAETMPYFELKEFIERERVKGSSMVPLYEIELYQRTSYPFATYVLVLIGISVASRKRRGGIGIGLAIGILISFMYIFAMKVTSVAATNLGFPAYLAVWIPNVTFAGLAYLLYKRAMR